LPFATADHENHPPGVLATPFRPRPHRRPRRLSAQDASTVVLPDYVLTATRTPAALTTTGTAVDSVSAAELARMQLNNITSALSGLPGAPRPPPARRWRDVALFARVQLQPDAVPRGRHPANDPNTDYQATLGGACLGACDNLEVSHGPQSTLYGGEAVGGVVSIRGQRGTGAAHSLVSLEAGSFGTIQGAASTQAGDEQGGYTFSIAGGHTDNERVNNKFDSTTYALRLDRKISAKVAVGATWRGFIGVYGSPERRSALAPTIPTMRNARTTSSRRSSRISPPRRTSATR